MGLLFAAGCTKANPAATCSDGTCTDPAFPFCDVDGSVGGEPGTCVAITCQAGANGGCQGSAALVCNANGTSFDPVACANGCDPNAGCKACTPGEVQCAGTKLQTCGSDAVFTDTETCELSCTTAPTPHCAYLSPKYVPDACDVPASGTTLTVSTSATIDSGLDNNCTGGVVAQTDGPEICVLHYERISVGSGATLTLVGTRAVALVADGDLTITGTVEVGATGGTSGPGGGTYESGGFPTSQFNTGSGGGGAGFRTPGGAGGNGTGDGATLNGGSASDAPGETSPLRGGPRAAFSVAGGGGGALTVVSCRSRVSVLGTIDSRGGGGAGGRVRSTPAADNPVAGAGAGAGGYVVVQGVSISVTGQTFANGGGGGAGNNAAFTPGNVNGVDGTASDTVCARGGIAPAGAGDGGAGGCGTGSLAQPGDGLHPPVASGTAGGGGGSMGFFQSYTPAGVTPTLLPAHASPGFQPNLTVETR